MRGIDYVCICDFVQGCTKTYMCIRAPVQHVGDAVFDSKFAKVVDFGSPESSNHTHHALKQACATCGTAVIELVWVNM